MGQTRESKLRPRKMPSCVSQKDKSHDDLMGFDLKCIKCNMGRSGEDLRNECKIPGVKLAFEGGERKWGKDKSGIYGAISSVTEKIPKIPENHIKSRILENDV